MASPPRIVTIFGASGFIGRQILRTISRTKSPHELTVRVASRKATASPVSYWRKLAPIIKDIQPVQCDLSNPDQIAQALEGATDVVNCVGILYETPSRGVTFERVQSQGPRAIADAIRSGNDTVRNVVHISAIGANKNSESNYARTKAAGEREIERLGESDMIRAFALRPSIVFGPEDSFFNRFADLSRFLPFLPLVAGGHTKLQPVHVEDVAEAVVKCLSLDGSTNCSQGTYELGGKTILTFKQSLELVLQAMGRTRGLLHIPSSIANMQGAAFEALHNVVPRIPPMLTRDQVKLLANDNVVSPGARTFADLEIEPKQCDVTTISYVR